MPAPAPMGWLGQMEEIDFSSQRRRRRKMEKTFNIQHRTLNAELGNLCTLVKTIAINMCRSRRREEADRSRPVNVPPPHVGGNGSWAFSAIALVIFLILSLPARAAEPIRALLICGGCCHDYTAQKKIISEGISARANVTWTLLMEGGDGHSGGTREHEMSIYHKPN